MHLFAAVASLSGLVAATVAVRELFSNRSLSFHAFYNAEKRVLSMVFASVWRYICSESVETLLWPWVTVDLLRHCGTCYV